MKQRQSQIVETHFPLHPSRLKRRPELKKLPSLPPPLFDMTRRGSIEGSDVMRKIGWSRRRTTATRWWRRRRKSRSRRLNESMALREEGSRIEVLVRGVRNGALHICCRGSKRAVIIIPKRRASTLLRERYSAR